MQIEMFSNFDHYWIQQIFVFDGKYKFTLIYVDNRMNSSRKYIVQSVTFMDVLATNEQYISKESNAATICLAEMRIFLRIASCIHRYSESYFWGSVFNQAKDVFVSLLQFNFIMPKANFLVIYMDLKICICMQSNVHIYIENIAEN
jgi:hypothetical protein